MTRVELLNAIRQAEKLTGRNAYHTMNSRRKHLLKDYPSEVICMVRLAAYNKHLENVIATGVAVQIVADALNGVALDDAAKKQLGKLINA